MKSTSWLKEGMHVLIQFINVYHPSWFAGQYLFSTKRDGERHSYPPRPIFSCPIQIFKLVGPRLRNRRICATFKTDRMWHPITVSTVRLRNCLGQRSRVPLEVFQTWTPFYVVFFNLCRSSQMTVRPVPQPGSTNGGGVACVWVRCLHHILLQFVEKFISKAACSWSFF